MPAETVTATYATRYDPDTDFDARYTKATADAIGAWLRPSDTVLELGCATGLMTSLLAPRGVRITAVDRFEQYLERGRSRGLSGVQWHQGDVMDWTDGRRYNHVVATGLLHELPDPDGLLARFTTLLGPAGLVHVSVPNPLSIHRIVALEMGLIDELGALSATSRTLDHHGHLAHDDLVARAERAGLRLVHREGVFLKPLPNAMLEHLPAEVLDGLARAGRHFPDHCAMNYTVFRGA